MIFENERGRSLCVFTKTELRPPDPLLGRTSIALSPQLYAYKSRGGRQKKLRFFFSVWCVCVLEYVCVPWHAYQCVHCISVCVGVADSIPFFQEHHQCPTSKLHHAPCKYFETFTLTVMWHHSKILTVCSPLPFALMGIV